jgi:DNA-binding MarR family transcriptional regulator
MIRKSKQSRSELVAAFARAFPELQDATDSFDEAAAELLGLNRTDLRALGAVTRRGPLSPSELADAARLSRSAMTTAIDRLEKAGYVRRVPDPEDRRGLRIEPTAEAMRAVGSVWGPLAEEGATMLARYSVEELDALVRILEDARAIQERHVERVRALQKKRKR